MKIYPTIISFDEFSHVFKSISKEKANQIKNTKNLKNKQKTEDSKFKDKDTLNINFNEFKDVLMRISCLAKQKLNEGIESLGNKNMLVKNKSRIAPQVRKNDRADGKGPIGNKSKSPIPKKELKNTLNVKK